MWNTKFVLIYKCQASCWHILTILTAIQQLDRFLEHQLTIQWVKHMAGSRTKYWIITAKTPAYHHIQDIRQPNAAVNWMMYHNMAAYIAMVIEYAIMNLIFISFLSSRLYYLWFYDKLQHLFKVGHGIGVVDSCIRYLVETSEDIHHYTCSKRCHNWYWEIALSNVWRCSGALYDKW